MVVALLREERDLRHEAERRHEVREHELTPQLPAHVRPRRDRRQLFSHARRGESRTASHVDPSGARRAGYFCAFSSRTAFVSAGRISNASPTMP